MKLLNISTADPDVLHGIPGEAEELDVLQKLSFGEGGEGYMHTSFLMRVSRKAEAALVGPAVHLVFAASILFQGEESAEERIAGPGVELSFGYQASQFDQTSSPLFSALHIEGALHLLETIHALFKGLGTSFQKGRLSHGGLHG